MRELALNFRIVKFVQSAEKRNQIKSNQSEENELIIFSLLKLSVV
jgi:hypothetical protein